MARPQPPAWRWQSRRAATARPRLEGEIETDLLWPGRDVAREPQPAPLIERRRRGELRRQQRGAVEIEIAPPEIEKALADIGSGMASLKVGRGQVAQHGVVAGAVGIIEREQGRADQIVCQRRRDRGGCRYRRGCRRRRGRLRQGPAGCPGQLQHERQQCAGDRMHCLRRGAFHQPTRRPTRPPIPPPLAP